MIRILCFLCYTGWIKCIVWIIAGIYVLGLFAVGALLLFRWLAGGCYICDGRRMGEWQGRRWVEEKREGGREVRTGN